MSGAFFVEVVQDRFDATAKAVKAAATSGRKPRVRRPVNGLVLHEESYATLRVMTSNGPRLLTDSGGRSGSSGKNQSWEYSNFLLQQVDDQRMEKQQILETFGEPYIFLFGERARVMNFSGVLLNTFNFNWEAEWWENYENLLRGTKCVENDARVFITVDNVLIGGYMIGCSSAKSAQERAFATLNFQLFVTSYANLTSIGDPHVYPQNVRDSIRASVTALQKFQTELDDSILNTAERGVNYLTRGYDTLSSTFVTYERRLLNDVSGRAVSVGKAIGYEGYIQSVRNPLDTLSNSSGPVTYRPDLVFSDLAYEYVQGNLEPPPPKPEGKSLLEKAEDFLTGTTLGHLTQAGLGAAYGLVAGPALAKYATTVDEGVVSLKAKVLDKTIVLAANSASNLIAPEEKKVTSLAAGRMGKGANLPDGG